MDARKISQSLSLVLLGAVLAGTGTAAAATGGTFVLGRDNTAATPTILRSSGTSANLHLPAARAGQPPLAVSSTSGKVNYFNADKLDGLDSTNFLRSTAKAADADKLDGLDSAQLQKRVTGTCPAGSSINAIAVAGTVSCSAGSRPLMQATLPLVERTAGNNDMDPVWWQSFTLVKPGFVNIMARASLSISGMEDCGFYSGSLHLGIDRKVYDGDHRSGETFHITSTDELSSGTQAPKTVAVPYYLEAGTHEVSLELHGGNCDSQPGRTSAAILDDMNILVVAP